MKKLTVAISAVAASVLMAMSAQAAEIYNKDSNKLDLYGKVNAKHTSTLMMQMMVILLMPVLASKVKPKSTINCLVSVSGNMNSKSAALNLKVPPKTKPVLHLQA